MRQEKPIPFQSMVVTPPFKNNVRHMAPKIIVSSLEFQTMINGTNKQDYKESGRRQENNDTIPVRVLNGTKSQKEITGIKCIGRKKNKEREIQGEKKQNKKATKVNNQREFQNINQKMYSLQNMINKIQRNFQRRQQYLSRFYEKQKKYRQKTNEKDRKNKKDPKQNLKLYVTQVSPPTRALQKVTNNPYSPKSNKYYVSQVIKFYKNQNSLVQQHLKLSLQTLRLLNLKSFPSQQQINQRTVHNPKRKFYQDKKTIVFDLDQTLIHCNEGLQQKSDFTIHINFPTGEVADAGINVRPHVFEMLQALSKQFQLILFTASHGFYANLVLNHIDPRNQFFQYRFYREHCIFTKEGVYVKDLRILNRDLASTVLVDNAAYSYAFQLDNGIPILPYYQGKDDYQLPALQKYLQLLALQKDVRDINRATFKLYRYQQFDDVEKMVQNLYIEGV